MWNAWVCRHWANDSIWFHYRSLTPTLLCYVSNYVTVFNIVIRDFYGHGVTDLTFKKRVSVFNGKGRKFLIAPASKPQNFGEFNGVWENRLQIFNLMCWIIKNYCVSLCEYMWINLLAFSESAHEFASELSNDDLRALSGNGIKQYNGRT